VTTAEGRAGYCSVDTKGSGDAGGVLQFRFPPVGNGRCYDAVMM
jgi:hypothetical protein